MIISEKFQAVRRNLFFQFAEDVVERRVVSKVLGRSVCRGMEPEYASSERIAEAELFEQDAGFHRGSRSAMTFYCIRYDVTVLLLKIQCF